MNERAGLEESVVDEIREAFESSPATKSRIAYMDDPAGPDEADVTKWA
jgi:hypothetical protein